MAKPVAVLAWIIMGGAEIAGDNHFQQTQVNVTGDVIKMQKVFWSGGSRKVINDTQSRLNWAAVKN